MHHPKLKIMVFMLGFLIITNICQPKAALANTFSDVNANDWYYQAVMDIYDQGLMLGIAEQEFGPQQSMTRAMLVTVLHRLEGEPIPEQNSEQFTDINPDSWYMPAVSWANNHNIVDGVGDGLFAPHNPLSREQLAIILLRYAGYCGKDTAFDLNDLYQFKDADQVADWSQNALAWAVTNEILLTDAQNKLNPKSMASRAEIAVGLSNFLD